MMRSRRDRPPDAASPFEPAAVVDGAVGDDDGLDEDADDNDEEMEETLVRGSCVVVVELWTVDELVTPEKVDADDVITLDDIAETDDVVVVDCKTGDVTVDAEAVL
jgi:hypothetical protein